MTMRREDRTVLDDDVVYVRRIGRVDECETLNDVSAVEFFE